MSFSPKTLLPACIFPILLTSFSFVAVAIMSSEKPRLSFLEYLDLGFVEAQAGEVTLSAITPLSNFIDTDRLLALTAILVLFTVPFRGLLGHRDFVTHVSFAAAKTRNRRASSRQLQ